MSLQIGARRQDKSHFKGCHEFAAFFGYSSANQKPDDLAPEAPEATSKGRFAKPEQQLTEVSMLHPGMARRILKEDLKQMDRKACPMKYSTTVRHEFLDARTNYLVNLAGFTAQQAAFYTLFRVAFLCSVLLWVWLSLSPNPWVALFQILWALTSWHAPNFFLDKYCKFLAKKM